MATSNGNQYYDLDAILAEEELIPCVTQDEFSYLAHLDPDASLVGSKQHYLKENTKLKLPLWAMESWTILGYCRCSLPRVFSSKARERHLLSDGNDSSMFALPRSDYFRIGKRIADLMRQTYLKQMTSPATNQRVVQYREYIEASSRHLQETLHLVRLEHCHEWDENLATFFVSNTTISSFFVLAGKYRHLLGRDLCSGWIGRGQAMGKTYLNSLANLLSWSNHFSSPVPKPGPIITSRRQSYMGRNGDSYLSAMPENDGVFDTNSIS